MGLKDSEQIKVWVSDDFMSFFRQLIAHEQLRHLDRRITQKSIFEKAVLRYSRQNYPDLIPPATMRR